MDSINWISNVVRPKIRSFLKRDTPQNLWIKCPESGQLVFSKDVEANLFVIPGSGHHMRMATNARLASMFDDGVYEEITLPEVPLDPLKFRDEKKYVDRLRDAKAKTSLIDAVKIAYGKVEALPLTIGVQDFDFMGGSLGMAAGEAFITAAQLALARKSSFVVCTASGGARMQEGTLSLMQMPRTTLAINDLADARLPYVVVLTDPTSGGVSASYAMLGDVHIAEPGAMIAFSGPRVIEQTIRESLPKGFQRSEFLREKGQVDIVCDRRKLKGTISRVLSHLLPLSHRRDDRSNIMLTPPKTHADKLPQPKGAAD